MQTLSKPSKSYNRQDWQRGYDSQPQEMEGWVEAISGEIPPQLQGTLFRNGPGLMDINGDRFHHPFDGDGLICAFTFDQGRVHFRNRFVRTEGFLKEQTEGKICYRGVFGTQKAGGWLGNLFDLNLKNIANTNVIYWGDRLLALWEAALPHRLDPRTLETIGLDNLDGLLKPGGAFSAHPRIDPHSELDNGAPCLVNFALSAGPVSKLTLYEFSPQGQCLRQFEQPIPGFAFIHDFAITPHYYLFFQNPIAFNPLPFVFGVKGAGQCISFQEQEPTKIVIIPRDRSTGEPTRTLKVKAGFVFHHANAWENADGTLGLESICYDSFPEVEPDADFRETKFDTLPPSQLWRFTIDPQAGTVERQLRDHRAVEFPTLHPQWVGRKHRYCYLAAADQVGDNAPLQGLIKLDSETGTQEFYSFAPRGFVSEPVFVPRGAGEEEGWIMMLVYDAARHGSDLAIFDAANITAGPVATVHLKLHIPYGLHGNWTGKTFVD
ncbi:MAG: Apocarotenoid-15,15'-oxygenase [Spirulina sp. SIO3F2]|nr:Apocarotenoid-15,15'-oxygenase [Spirulina sp. SIO3F2]